MAVLHVVGAAVLDPRGLLLVSKRSAPEVFFLPGGKPEDGETALGCLRRELREELGVGLARAEPFGEVRAPAALEDRELHMRVFLAALDGEPSPASEIASLAWWTEGQVLELAPAVGDWLIPRLRAVGLSPGRARPGELRRGRRARGSGARVGRHALSRRLPPAQPAVAHEVDHSDQDGDGGEDPHPAADDDADDHRDQDAGSGHPVGQHLHAGGIPAGSGWARARRAS
jgi:8-oxo-dGTP diphosphatase